MSSYAPEPTNEQLYQQPPRPQPQAPGQSLAPIAPSVAPAPQEKEPATPRQVVGKHQFVLAIVSLGLGVPLTGIGVETAGVFGLIIAWVGIVLVNLVHGFVRKDEGV